MAYYIGIRYGSISVYSSTYMTANSRGTYSINSYFTKLDATWNYNNVLYDVYTYTSTDIDSLLRNLSCFIHNGGSGIIEKRQLSDGAEYVEQYTTATYPGHNSYVSGEIYLFGARKKQTVRNDKWCYTYTEKYDTNVGSSGSSARMYVNTKKTPSGIDTVDMGMSGSGGTRIIEFYNTSAVSGISVGLTIFLSWSRDVRSGLSPPCIHIILSLTKAAIGRLLKQSLNNFHSFTLYLLLHSSKKPYILLIFSLS